MSRSTILAFLLAAAAFFSGRFFGRMDGPHIAINHISPPDVIYAYPIQIGDEWLVIGDDVAIRKIPNAHVNIHDLDVALDNKGNLDVGPSRERVR